MTRNLLKLIVAIIAISIAAQITIEVPINNGAIPITGQTLAVLLVGYFLGKVWGTIAVLSYVILGALGLPIFADGKAGWAVLTGGSGGYLIGFVVAAYVVGWWKEWARKRNFFSALLNQSIGTIVILVFGVGWLAYLYGMEKGLEYGFYPFWQGAVIKILLGAGVIWASKWIQQKSLASMS